MKKLSIRTTDESVQTICKRDPMMKKLIRGIGNLEIELRSDYLSSLVRSIVGQQISVPAARAIYGRLLEAFGGNITVEGILHQTKEELHRVGLTKRKTDYIKDLAENIFSGNLDLKRISTYDNQEIIKQLMDVKGIGKWTAEMFLILSLGRMDVLAVDDRGNQRAAKWLYQVDQSERRNILVEQSNMWKPYRSVASFYLWEATHLELLTDYESIDSYLEIY